MAATELELINRVRVGDAEALAAYLEHMRPQLLAIIQRQLGDGLRRKVEPEDILQEASAEAIRSLGAVDFDQRAPFPWLCQIIEHKVIDAHRHFFAAQKRDAAREVPMNRGGGDASQVDFVNLLINSLTTPSQAFSRNAREARLHEALGELPDVQRQALTLRYLENVPSKEIARRLDKSDAAVRVMLSRALQRLRQTIGTELPR